MHAPSFWDDDYTSVCAPPPFGSTLPPVGSTAYHDAMTLYCSPELSWETAADLPQLREVVDQLLRDRLTFLSQDKYAEVVGSGNYYGWCHGKPPEVLKRVHDPNNPKEIWQNVEALWRSVKQHAYASPAPVDIAGAAKQH